MARRTKAVHFRTFLSLVSSCLRYNQGGPLSFKLGRTYMATLHKKPKKKSPFDAQVFLESVGASRSVAEFRDKEIIFSQGDAADSVLYIQNGSVKLTVVNESGK